MEEQYGDDHGTREVGQGTLKLGHMGLPTERRVHFTWYFKFYHNYAHTALE
jgi:hypothetical protein